MRADFDRLDALNTQLMIAQRLTAVALHVIDDRIRLHLALTLLEPELQTACVIANRFIHELYMPEGPVYEPDPGKRAIAEHETDQRIAEERRALVVPIIGPVKLPPGR